MRPLAYVAACQRVVGSFGSCLDCNLWTCCSKPFQVIENFRVWSLGVGKLLSEFTTTLVVVILSACIVQKHTLCQRCVLPLLLKTNGLRLWLIPSWQLGGCGHFAIALVRWKASLQDVTSDMDHLNWGPYTYVSWRRYESIFFSETMITVGVKFRLVMGTSFKKMRSFFFKVFFIISILFPPLCETLYPGCWKLRWSVEAVLARSV